MKVGPEQVDCPNDYDITIGRSRDSEKDEMKVLARAKRREHLNLSLKKTFDNMNKLSGLGVAMVYTIYCHGES